MRHCAASQLLADAIVRLGLKDMGFSYVNLDGGWQGGRHANGTVYENATKFPAGMRALAQHVHGLGLRFGAYTDRGKSTCDGHVGSAGYEASDALTYASWPADFVKEDACDATQAHAGAIAQYRLMADAIAASGRPMYFSLCGWLSWYAAAASAAGVGDSWRIGPDALSWPNVLMNFDAAADVAPYVRSGALADIDEIMGPSRGRPISRAQTLTQVALISIIGSPMLLSFDLTNLTAADPDVAPFLNPEVITEVHQDAAPGGPYYRRLSGGYVAPDRIPALTHLACDASDARTRWVFNASVNASAGSLRSIGAPGLCLTAGAAWTGECNNAQGASRRSVCAKVLTTSNVTRTVRQHSYC